MSLYLHLKNYPSHFAKNTIIHLTPSELQAPIHDKNSVSGVCHVIAFVFNDVSYFGSLKVCAILPSLEKRKMRGNAEREDEHGWNRGRRLRQRK